MTPQPLLLFDGPCRLCQRSVRFILKHEREPTLHFASLESEIGQRLSREHDLPEDLDAVVWIDDQGAVWGADAAFQVCGLLRRPWRWLRILRLLPSRLTEAGYRMIANRRHRWFGRTPDCPLPDPEVAERFHS